MEFTALQVAELLEGKVEGDEKVMINKLAKIEEGEKELFNLSFKRRLH